MNKPLLKWSPAMPIRKPDNIISSRAREKNHLGFIPSYESESIEHMNLLMSNEYMRIWFKERAVYEKDTYTREQIIKEENKIKRRFVQRMMTYRKPTKNQFIDENIRKRNAEKNTNQYAKLNERQYEKYKFKPQCPPVKKELEIIEQDPNGNLSKLPKNETTQNKNKNAKAEIEKDNDEEKKLFNSDGECCNCRTITVC